MKPAPFEYAAPRSLEEALALLAEHGDEAKVLAGGQSLVPAMNFRLAQPKVLVDINRVAGLERLQEHGGELRVGALVRQRGAERSADVARAAPLLAAALPSIAHLQIRNRGTVVGSLAHADPAAELPAVALALRARLKLVRRGGERWLTAEGFFTGLFATALAPEEMVEEVRFPAAAATARFAFREVARRHGDYALAGVAAALDRTRDGRCAGARIALFGVGEGPVLATTAAAALAERRLDAAAVRDAAAGAAREIDPPGDIHASSAFRRHLVGVLVERALGEAAGLDVDA